MTGKKQPTTSLVVTTCLALQTFFTRKKPKYFTFNNGGIARRKGTVSIPSPSQMFRFLCCWCLQGFFWWWWWFVSLFVLRVTKLFYLFHRKWYSKRNSTVWLTSKLQAVAKPTTSIKIGYGRRKKPFFPQLKWIKYKSKDNQSQNPQVFNVHANGALKKRTTECQQADAVYRAEQWAKPKKDFLRHRCDFYSSYLSFISKSSFTRYKKAVV